MDEVDEVDQVIGAVGPRLRALRTQRGTTLAALSATTGISQSTLSRLESGQRRPNLELLLPLARAYGVPLDDLVGAPATGDPRVHLKPLHRRGMTFVPLSRRPGGVQAFKVVYPARWHAEHVEPQTHPGHEWLYVLSGRLRLRLGDEEHVLSPGEVAEFDTRLPHLLLPADDRSVEAIVLFGPDGERAHVRLSAPERR